MSILTTEVLRREFRYQGSTLADPGPAISPEQVRELYTPQYPELATAVMTGPEDCGNVLRYTFSRAIGSKG
jgi:PRTRC genetic system protein C